jgi:hypothetical protein
VFRRSVLLHERVRIELRQSLLVRHHTESEAETMPGVPVRTREEAAAWSVCSQCDCRSLGCSGKQLVQRRLDGGSHERVVLFSGFQVAHHPQSPTAPQPPALARALNRPMLLFCTAVAVIAQINR